MDEQNESDTTLSATVGIEEQALSDFVAVFREGISQGIVRNISGDEWLSFWEPRFLKWLEFFIRRVLAPYGEVTAIISDKNEEGLERVLWNWWEDCQNGTLQENEHGRK